MKVAARSMSVILGVGFVGGCASSVTETISTAVADAPDWFKERREELSTQDYPDLRDIPKEPVEHQTLEQAELERDLLLEEAKELEADPKALSPTEEGRPDPSVWADEVRDELEKAAAKVN